MAKLDSGALSLIQRALRIAGARQQQTFLEDGSVQTVIDIQQIASSSMPGTRDKGLFLIYAENEHAGAGQLTSAIDVYDPGTLLNMQPEDLDGYDVWLHMAAISCSTTANFGAAAWLLDNDNITPAITDGLTSTPDFPLAAFLDIEDLGQVIGTTPVMIGMRMPRTPAGLRWTSEAGGVIDITGVIVAELVPEGLRPGGF